MKVSEKYIIDFVVVFVFSIPVVCPDVALIHVVAFYVKFDVHILTVCDLKIFH